MSFRRRTLSAAFVAGLGLALVLPAGCGLGWTAADLVVGFGSVAVSLLLDAINPEQPGPQGPPGDDGAGQPTPDGLQPLYLSISEFYTTTGTANGQVDLGTVRISEPALGTPDPDTGRRRAVAFRFTIPPAYQPQTPLNLRLFLYRTGPRRAEFCFAFRIDAWRLVSGMGVQAYGAPAWVRPLLSGRADPELLVIDLPFNDPDGLGYPDDLAPAHIIAIEFNTSSPPEEGGLYTLLGAEIFESAGDVPVAGAMLFANEAATGCSPDS